MKLSSRHSGLRDFSGMINERVFWTVGRRTIALCSVLLKLSVSDKYLKCSASHISVECDLTAQEVVMLDFNRAKGDRLAFSLSAEVSG